MRLGGVDIQPWQYSKYFETNQLSEFGREYTFTNIYHLIMCINVWWVGLEPLISVYALYQVRRIIQGLEFSIYVNFQHNNSHLLTPKSGITLVIPATIEYQILKPQTFPFTSLSLLYLTSVYLRSPLLRNYFLPSTDFIPQLLSPVNRYHSEDCRDQDNLHIQDAFQLLA